MSETTTYCCLGSASAALFPELVKSPWLSPAPLGAREELSSPSSRDFIHSFKSMLAHTPPTNGSRSKGVYIVCGMDILPPPQDTNSYVVPSLSLPPSSDAPGSANRGAKPFLASLVQYLRIFWRMNCTDSAVLHLALVAGVAEVLKKIIIKSSSAYVFLRKSNQGRALVYRGGAGVPPENKTWERVHRVAITF